MVPENTREWGRKLPIAFQSLDAEGRIREVNAEWERLSGYVAADAVGHPYRELVPAESVADFDANISDLLTTGLLEARECRLRRKDGSVRKIQIYARWDQESQRSDCLLVDITQFRQAEHDLADSEHRFRALFDLAPMPVFVHDGTTVRLANQASAEFLGYRDPSELEGSPAMDFVAPEDRERVRERIDQMLHEDWVAPFAETRYVRKDGTFIVGDTVASPIDVAGERLVHVIAIDLTESHMVANALEESEQRFQHLFEFAGDPIVVHDGVSVIIANRAARSGFGIPAEMDVHGLELTRFIAEESRPLVAERVGAMLTGADSETPIELNLIRTDGSEMVAEVKSAPLYLGGRRVLQTTFRDLTERKRSERELSRYRAQLEELLEERTRSLEQVRQELGAVTAVISRTVEMRDPYTAGHQRRVAALAVAIAEQLELDDREIEQLRVAALLHDVGKVSVPAELLSKPTTLSALEYELVKTHVEAGYDIVCSAEFDNEVASMIRQHHERPDGTGYPLGLSAEDIVSGALILQVADVVEAMSSHRPYRPSRGVGVALDEIRRGRGICYDAAVVDACVTVMETGFEFESDPAT